MEEKKGCLYRLFRLIVRTVKIVLILMLLVLGVLAGLFAPQLYNRFSVYPRQAAAWKDLADARQPVQLKTGWNEYRGVMHSHSELSHDSLVPFPEIVDAMHEAKCEFIFMSDHVDEGKADYSKGWKGVHDGVLFIRGFEMQQGFFPWGLPDDTVLLNSEDPAALAKRIRELGGILCFGHNEGMRMWELPELEGMEIYNIHTDMMDELMDRSVRLETVKNILLNSRAYGEQTFRGMFDPWVLAMVMQKWDEQSKHRKITAYAANDCHQNVGLRGLYTERDTLLLIDTGHDDPEKKVAEYKLNSVTRPLLGAIFGELKPGRQLFRIDMDPYARSSRFVNTHLLASDLTEPALIDALRSGRAFIAFNMLADAKGFAFVADDGGKLVTMGESIALAPGLKLRAESPLSCHFTLVRRGDKVAEQDGTTFEYEVKEPGKYRLEAALPMPGETAIAGEDFLQNMAPWVITNPIEVTSGAAQPAAPVPPQPAAPVEAPPAAPQPAPPAMPEETPSLEPMTI